MKKTSITAIALLLLGYSSASAESWEFLSRETLSVQASVYKNTDGITRLSDGTIYAPKLVVFDQMQRGVETFDRLGGSFIDTRYPHRSVFHGSVYDCRRGTVAQIHTVYFSENRPSEAAMVAYFVEDDPAPTALLVEYDVMYRYVCGQ